MGIYVNLLQEIYNRLDFARSNPIGSRSILLDEIKNIWIGNHSAALGNAELPAITINWKQAEETTESASYSRLVSNIELIFTIFYPISDIRVNNYLYDYDSNSGFVFLIEKILDVLSSNDVGDLNPSIENKLKIRQGISIGNIELLNDSLMRCEITMQAKLQQFVINERS